MKAPKYPFYFIGLSMICLLACVLMGLTGAFQYVFPDLFKSLLSFEKIRPLHTLFATSWILLAAIGGIYFYLHQEGLPIKAGRWRPWLHLELFVGCGLTAAGLYIAGIFGGREYMEFVYPLSAPILLGWLLFAFNYFTAVAQWTKPWPVYFWMWATGVVFFIFTFSESFLWLFPYFRNHIVRDITVQWKANGALVGSWNMLIYGTSIYVMNKIKPDSKSVRGTLPFALFFVGLTNLMFGWAHHTYIVPAAPWVRHVSYLISMTEWLLLARVIYTWKKSLLPETKLLHLMTYKLLYSANVWVFINLAIALLISIPAINYYTHGTQITVAHAMGTTIGINTPLLLASLFLILGQKLKTTQLALSKWGFLIFHGSLGLFFLGLLLAGLIRSRWMNSATGEMFQEMHQASLPGFLMTLVSGLGITTGLALMLWPLWREVIVRIKR